ncbi:hypothetical protein [Cytobacillus firmus]|uniref:hypothetical protein n=1 Tax=Cytobacillus firmus TaxID=1399 RepID=UPI002228210B|nr:hypothetical protein [Cytobacillus firmus]
MKSPAKGALAMVIAGSITFSVTNSLLQTAKLLSEENSFILSGIQKKSEVNRQVDKQAEAQILAVQDNEKQKTVTKDAPAPKESLITGEKSNKAIVAVQPNKEVSNRKTAAVSVSNKKPSAPKPASSPAGSKTTNEAARPETSNTPAPGTGGNNTTSPAAKTLNHGQQVSQAAKEKAESNRINKGNESNDNKGENM